MVLRRAILLSSLMLVLGSVVGCGSLKRHDEIRNQSEVGEESVEGEMPIVAELPADEDPSSQVSSNISKPYRSPLGNVALDQNKHVDMWVRYFQGRGRKHMERYLERSSRYLPMMKNVLRENGLPEELVYIALIESGFSPVAHSHANAVGYWQFIRGTGKRYGLKLDSYIDERRDPVLSTRAAAEYFKALYNLFGDWHLAMASYNCGENRVKRQTMRLQTRDFWNLVRRRALPRETRNYVPKYIAATMIAQNPEKYGFTNIEYQAPLSYDTVKIPHPLSLKALAQGMGADVEELKLLNPKFRGDYVPLYDGTDTVIRVPTGKTAVALANLARAEVKTPPIVKADYVYYRVRRGDTLGHIAVRFRTRVSTIRRLNRLGSRSFIRVGQRLRVPERGYSQVYASTSAPQRSASSQEDVSVHVVRRGENLTLIARRYGTSVDDLRRLNRLPRRAVIKVGQRIVVKEDQGTADSSAPGTSHMVTRGENLTAIANRYNTSVQAIKNVNGLKSDIVLVGQRLNIPGRGRVVNKPFYHQVERGENLTYIAQKYGTSIASLRNLNRIRSNSVLYVGQKLKISNRSMVHVVRRGETLGLIAQRYKITLRELIHANDIENKRLIVAGQSLIIPD